MERTPASPGGLKTRPPPDGLLRDLMLNFVALSPEQIDPAIAAAQAKLAEALEIERSVLVELPDGDLSPPEMLCCRAFPSGGDSFGCLQPSCSVCQRLLRGEPVLIGRPGEPAGEQERQAPDHCPLAFKSIVGFPLSEGETVFGALLFARSPEQPPWVDELVVQLEFAAQVFGRALAAKRALAARGRAGGSPGVANRQPPPVGGLQRSANLAGCVLDSLYDAVIVLDKDGVITGANEAWKRSAREHGLDPAAVSCGVNYLEVCRRAAANGDVLAGQALESIEVVLRGSHRQAVLEYPCHSPAAARWFLMRVTPLGASQGGVVIVHADITQLGESQEALRRALAEVEQLKNKVQQENVYLRQKATDHDGLRPIVGQSQAVRRVFKQAEQVARTDSTVLLLGETGTGKELLAASIHKLSARRDRPLVSVNCAAMPGALVESELFGREKGAFTGSLSRQIGRFELAHGSTIFLDEVAELSLEVQAKLLRVLEAKQIERLGNPKPISVDVRIIAATNRDLEKAVGDGKFRQDLYYRLNVFPITLPPLRERPEDIPQLVWAFVDEFAKTFSKNIESIARESIDALQRYAWPGNIRELRNLIERAMIVATGPVLRIQLPATPGLSPTATSRKLEEVEREHVLGILEKSGWCVRGPNGAALTLGLKPTTLEARMAKLGIKRPRLASEE